MSFQDAYERILQSTGLRTQTDVAAMLGVKQSSISDAKRRNTGEAINLAEARSLAQEHERLVSRRVTRK